MARISEDDLVTARRAWGEGLITISRAFEAGGIDPARSVADAVIDSAYGFAQGPVLFKPTLSGGDQTFRTTRKGALSYFVGHDPDFPNDNGFGLMGWRKVTSETAESFIEGDVALWMGWVIMTDRDGLVTKVDKSFGYRKDGDALRIVLHHSSLPYTP
jgi:hypothetical protein